ncbi:MAG: exopolysaccharide biosynthesis protein [Paracoccaceae bacterium]|uniref:exopolysaccharide biosynthesis protein n=1 Tax=unclassified Seohaeicola TaxID=2641111 RepID=UPI00237B1F33|nr:MULTISPECIES: exopolysaccharide biosynthesis protein [unclassified Seohaeicola]MDD9708794.1 exopolysaccharide biosynthesis protein [Seohaeicola sp. 4SK31]MDD9734915.1 exopolysaccharide biosynthesis protein [Seohaeicola sp. SP36]MDF1706865.1 exopolysaccharide biosynthesis protein [Paracoccaceae bacterium]MDM7968012.1 exopolysaccharide biosynthesis protein [Paracoccaceae bacterium]
MNSLSPLTPAPDDTVTAVPLSLTGLLAAIRPQDHEDAVTLGEILSRIGQRSFAATLMVIGLLMVSPLSAIPFLPSLVAIVILLIAGQAIIGRHHLWLPEFLTRRRISAEKLRRALDTLTRPAAWIDAHRSGRWVILTQWPISSLAYVVIIVIALTWPPLSFVPFSTTLSAVGMSLLAAGQTLKDGIFVLLGYAYLALLVTGVSVAVAGVL